MSEWEFCIRDGPNPGPAFKLKAGVLLLGSSPECHIVSAAPGVAPRHAEFLASDAKLHIRVLQNAAPVLINGVAVHGLEELRCPATVVLGTLCISVETVAPRDKDESNQDSTLRIVHAAGTYAPQPTDGSQIDVTGRIFCHLQKAEDAEAGQTKSIKAQQVLSASHWFSHESTMAFSMDSSDPEMDESVPVRTDYSVKSEIARGGMGKIYSAEDPELKRLVALKVSTLGDSSKNVQFFDEARTLAALEHPNIVPIHNTGVDSTGRPFYSMKLIQGQTLQSVIKRLAEGDRETAMTFKRERLLDIFRKACDAVAFAHSKGYLHRDLKPDNIMVGEFGEVLVMDWGLAKRISRHRANSNAETSEEQEPETLPYIEGTPQYMSPEQANGMYGGLDERSDIYSLGGVLYAILVLRPPVSGASLNEVLEKVRSGATTTMALPSGTVRTDAPASQSIPEALRAVTLKALARERERRYPSVQNLTKDLEAYLAGFATQAEEATFVRQVVLLLKRHRLASITAGIALIGALIFTCVVVKSERSAQRSAKAARLAADQAEAEKQRVRKEQARAQIALAEAAEQAQDAGQMQRALDLVDKDFRDQDWHYLSLLSGSEDTPIDLNGRPPWINFEPHPENRDLLLALHDDGWIRTVNLATGVVEDLVDAKLGAAERFKYFRLAISPNAVLAAVSAFDEKGKQMHVRLIDLKAKIKRPDFLFPSNGWQHPYLEFDKNGTVLLVSLTDPARFHVLNTVNGAVRWQWPKEEDKETEKRRGIACLSADQSSVLLRRVNETPTEVALATGEPKGGTSKDGFRISTADPENFAFSTNEKSVFNLSNGILRKFETQSGKKVFDERLPNGSWQARRRHPSSLSTFPDENIAVTLTQVTDESAVILLHDGNDGRVTQTHLVKTDRSKDPAQLVTHPLSKRVAVVRGNSMRVWSLSQPVPKAELTVLSYSNDGISFLNSPATLVTTGTVSVDREAKKTEASFKILNLRKPSPDWEEATFPLTSEDIPNAAVYVIRNPAGNWLGARFWGGRDLTIYSTDNGSLREIRRFAVTENYWEMRFSPSGQLIWTTTGLFETTTGKRLKTTQLEGYSDRTERIPPVWIDESRMAQIRMVPRNKDHSETNNDRVTVSWEIESAHQSRVVSAPDALWLDASPDGTQLVEAGADTRVRVRNAATLEVQKTMRVHEGPVTAVAWNPTLPVIATASSDYSVKVWDLKNETLLEEFRFLHNIMAARLMWSPDGRMLAVSDTSDPRERPNLKVYEPKSCEAMLK